MKFVVVDGNLEMIGEFAKTRKPAIRNSLKKWQAIVEALEAGEDHVYATGAGTCNLCELYYDDADGVFSECNGCPIQKRTGQGECLGTAYYQYRDADNHGQALRAARRMARLIERLAD